MTAEKVLKQMEFKDWSYARVGQYDAELMSATSDELFQLDAGALSVSLDIDGDCLFEYAGENFELLEDIEDRPDVIQAIREGTIDFETKPEYEFVFNTEQGDLIERHTAPFAAMPPRLVVLGMLIEKMEEGFAMHLAKKTPEQRAFQESLQHFHVHSQQLPSNADLDEVSARMNAFLHSNEELFHALATVRTEAIEDTYGDKWFAIFYYTESKQAVEDIRKELFNY